MELTGKQKAAMLLTQLDATTAIKLLEGIEQEKIRELVLELLYLDTIDDKTVEEEGYEVMEQFGRLLEANEVFHVNSFLKKVLPATLGKEAAEEFQVQIGKATKKSDQFIAARLASTEELAFALESEHSQTIAVVLSELPPKKSQQVLTLLDEELRRKTVCMMINVNQVLPAVKQRMASVVSQRLKICGNMDIPQRKDQTIQKLASMLSGLKRNVRDSLLEAINERDEEVFVMIKDMMLTWEDILKISGRSLQPILQTVDVQTLAVALYGADQEINKNIRSNISERNAIQLDEEIALMQEPLEEDIIGARERILGPLREENEKGQLRFET